MKRRIQTLAALAGILAALTCTAHAKASPQGLGMLAAISRRSDSNLRWARLEGRDQLSSATASDRRR